MDDLIFPNINKEFENKFLIPFSNSLFGEDKFICWNYSEDDQSFQTFTLYCNADSIISIWICPGAKLWKHNCSFLEIKEHKDPTVIMFEIEKKFSNIFKK